MFSVLFFFPPSTFRSADEPPEKMKKTELKPESSCIVICVVAPGRRTLAEDAVTVFKRKNKGKRLHTCCCVCCRGDDDDDDAAAARAQTVACIHTHRSYIHATGRGRLGVSVQELSAVFAVVVFVRRCDVFVVLFFLGGEFFNPTASWKEREINSLNYP